MPEQAKKSKMLVVADRGSPKFRMGLGTFRP
jgi:hypothetical protein